MKTIHQWSEIPDFETPEEEATFWDTHSLSPQLWNQVRPGDPELDEFLSEIQSITVVGAEE
ncbi:hypothetical protein [Deinococcus cellulosilyticus]|nr:hypothetical protein [Deinococcus cellulosilyticus]